MPSLASGEGAALLDRFRRYLRDHRQPVTRQRDLVAQVLFLSDDHPSVDGIRRALKERGEHVGTATVYRTLEVLVQSGLVRAHDFGEGFKRYEPARDVPHHEHLMCRVCGRVEEFRDERLERMTTLIADAHAFSRESHRLVIYGVCDRCRRGEPFDAPPLTHEPPT